MEVYLKRGRQPSCLHLFPLSVDRFQEFFAQLTGPSGQAPQLAIERFVGPIECLERSLKGMALRSLADVSQLNELVEKAEWLGERDLKILSGALDMEKIPENRSVPRRSDHLAGCLRSLYSCTHF